ncbi:hypothetical protein FXB91_04635 [Aggregatibacter actinomycetemcomitans]|uniref:hypothetical protein n=1 Tax=Aggregatibacter actinomycetemcomitans TaxID=714 RepID=UPI0011DAEFBB|nr:hypothetical protein [Aggregatibacter actinomycetemcomitans]TYA23492.1 hypothetical protein FXB91_04635 [Aggregatibacter actinomycetemcomitans]
MATVKIRFSIEIDNELLINHQIEQEKNASFRKERELAEEVINKLSHSSIRLFWLRSPKSSDNRFDAAITASPKVILRFSDILVLLFLLW